MAITLKAQKREDLSRSTTKQLRAEGFIPAVVYGKDQEPKTVSVDNIELLKTVRDEGRNAIISLDIENDDKVNVMVQDYQTDVLKGELIHVDFFAVDLSEEIDVDVQVRLDGDAPGVREGGVLQQPLFELQLRAKPTDIPEEIVVDVSALNIGDSLAVADLPKSDKYEILEDDETTIAVVLAPDTAEEETDTDVDFSAEPELVGAKEEEDQE